MVQAVVQALNLIGRRGHATTADALGRLVSYDLLILRRSARAAFSAKRDILLVIVAAVVGLLIAVQRAGAAVAAIEALPLLAKQVSQPRPPSR